MKEAKEYMQDNPANASVHDFIGAIERTFTYGNGTFELPHLSALSHRFTNENATLDYVLLEKATKSPLYKCPIGKHSNATMIQHGCGFMEVRLLIHRNGWPTDEFVEQKSVLRIHITGTRKQVSV